MMINNYKRQKTNKKVMTVNQYIKKLESLQPKLREKDILIQCPNGLIVEPDIKILFEDDNFLGGIDAVKGMIITY